MPHSPGSDTDCHLVTSHTLRIDTSSCDDPVTDKRVYDPPVEQVKNSGSEKLSAGDSTQEGTVHEKFLDIIHLNNGRFEVSFPWKEQYALVSDNYAQAVSHLASVLKRLRKNPGLFEEYNRIIVEQSSPGIIFDVDPDKPVEIGHRIIQL